MQAKFMQDYVRNLCRFMCVIYAGLCAQFMQDYMRKLCRIMCASYAGLYAQFMQDLCTIYAGLCVF